MSDHDASYETDFDDGATHVKVQLERAQQELAELRARRSAEAVAAADAFLDYDHRQFELAKQLYVAERSLAEAKAEVDAILRTRIFRYTSSIRKHYFNLRTAKKVVTAVATPAVVEGAEPEPPYELWISTYDTVDEPMRARLRELIGQMADPPLISVLLPAYDTPIHFLHEAIASIRTQIYPNWELCIVDDCSTDPAIAPAMEEIAREDPRIKFARRQNGHISAASNTALGMASGSWVAFLDHDDLLAETALAFFALEIDASPGVGFIYSDEDKVSEQGRRTDPFFKPEFDPVLLLGQNYLCHLSVIRRDLVEQVGGFREGYEGSQDWDLALRVTESLSTDQIAHIPRILYHWRIHSGSTSNALSAKSYAGGAGERAVRDHIERLGRGGEVIHLPTFGWNRVKWPVPEPAPLVSIIIPTRDGRFLARCIESIKVRTTYPNMEVLVVDNGSLSNVVLEYLRENESWVNVVRDESPFNFPDINNRAVARSKGDIVCLLNDDTEVLGGDWLDEMVGQLSQPGVGAVGAKLYYSNGLVQHAGVVLGIRGVAGHPSRLSDRLTAEHHGQTQLSRTYSAVTAACVAIRREAWDQVGGMDGNLPVAFNDIDLCLRLGEAGWRIVWTPFAELIHHESISRGPDTEGEAMVRFNKEVEYMKRRWGPLLRNDPAYNPNLTLIAENLSLAWPPRTLHIG